MPPSVSLSTVATGSRSGREASTPADSSRNTIAVLSAIGMYVQTW